VAPRRVEPGRPGRRLEHRPPYAMRHTYAAFAIAANIPTFMIARFMGTSVEQIEKTYGHLLPDAAEMARDLDTFDDRAQQALRRGTGASTETRATSAYAKT
jgi:integrase